MDTVGLNTFSELIQLVIGSEVIDIFISSVLSENCYWAHTYR